MYEVLKTGGRAGSGGIRTRMRNTLVAIELALATMLLIGAGLFIQTLVNLQSVKLGFEPHAHEMRFSHPLQHNVDHVVTRLTRERWQERPQQ